MFVKFYVFRYNLADSSVVAFYRFMSYISRYIFPCVGSKNEMEKLCDELGLQADRLEDDNEQSNAESEKLGKGMRKKVQKKLAESSSDDEEDVNKVCS